MKHTGIPPLLGKGLSLFLTLWVTSFYSLHVTTGLPQTLACVNRHTDRLAEKEHGMNT